MSNYTRHELNKMPYWERLHNNPSEDGLIVITLHWMNGTAEAMAFLFEGIEFPVREIAIQGTYPSGFEEGGYSWFERERDFYDMLSEAEQAPYIQKTGSKIATFIQSIREKYPHSKVAITGMSQGGDLTLHLTAHHPQLVDLACAMAGRLSEPMRPNTITADTLPKVVMLLGLDDHIVLPEPTRAAKSWLQTQNFDVSLHEYAGVGHDISEDMIDKIRAEMRQLTHP